MKSISSIFYDLARNAVKIASITNDVENLADGRPDKVVKKHIRKEVYKGTNSIGRKINQLFK